MVYRNNSFFWYFDAKYIKENSNKKIANSFQDEFIDIEKENKKLSKLEKKELNKIKKDTNDDASNWLKSIARVGTISFNIFAKTISFTMAGIGIE